MQHAGMLCTCVLLSLLLRDVRLHMLSLTLLVCLTLQAPRAANRGDQNPAPARKRQHTAAANVDLHDLTLLGGCTGCSSDYGNWKVHGGSS
jgi:hypothetical protein